MASRQVLLLAAVTAIAVAFLPAPASAEVYKVGDDAGWTLKYPKNWTDNKNFTVGDSLMFVYPPGQHTVVEVTGPGFRACDVTGNQALGSWSSGSDTIELGKAGRRWFVCGVGDHCTQGMKLLVSVVDGKPSSASLNYKVGGPAALVVAGAVAALMF